MPRPRLQMKTLRAFQTSSTGMPAMGEPGSSCAAGFTMSLAPMTITTSVITENSIYGNGTVLSRQGAAASGLVGLDLQTTGDNTSYGTAPYYTPNDADDVDTGGNSLQNFPVIDFASSDGSQLAVSGSFNSLATRTYRIEFFLSDEYANGHGQGETYLGSINVTTDGSGNATFATTMAATIPTGMQVTATATDLTTKETSEFSQQFAINDAPHILGQNAITNAQFTTDLSDWSTTGDVDWQSSEVRFGQLGSGSGVLSQTFTTEIGKEYFLTFEYGDRSATKSQSVQVDVNGSASLLAEGITSGVAENALQLYTYSFVADSTTTTLSFTDTSADHSGVRGYIDNVEVRPDSTPLTAIDYTENDGAVQINNGFNFADVDDSNLESAAITISGNYANGEDVLTFVDTANITGVWDSATGTLTLTGTDSLANYEVALRSITYTNTSDDPSTLTRTVSFTVNDGDENSNVSTRDINVTAGNDAPVISVTGDSPTWTESGPVDLFSGASVDLVEAADNVASLVFTVDGLADGSDERLILDGESFELTDLVTGTSDSRGYDVAVSVSGTTATVTISKSGGFSSSDAQTLINAIAYDNQSDAPSGTTRTVTFQSINEDAATNQTTSDGTTSIVTMSGVNDAPEFVGPELITNGTFDSDLSGWTTTGSVINLGPGELNFGGGDVAGPHTASQIIATEAGQTYRLTFDYRDGSTTKNQSLQVTVDGSSNLLTTSQIVTDIDGNTFVRYEYTFTADSSASTLTFTDTSDTAGVADGTIAVDGKVDNVSVKQIDGHLGTAGFTEGGSAVVLDTDVTLFDADIEGGLDNYDNTTLTIVRNGGASGNDVFSATGNLDPLTESGALVLSSQTVGTVDANSAGTLTLRFNSSVNQAILNEVLRSIAYENTSAAPASSVQLDWTFADDNFGTQQGTGGEQFATGYTVVNITADNDAPTVDVSTGQTVSEGGGIVLSSDNLSSSDTDNDDSTLIYTIDSGLTNGFCRIGFRAIDTDHHLHPGSA